jgi:hypothetical protein
MPILTGLSCADAAPMHAAVARNASDANAILFRVISLPPLFLAGV